LIASRIGTGGGGGGGTVRARRVVTSRQSVPNGPPAATRFASQRAGTPRLSARRCSRCSAACERGAVAAQALRRRRRSAISSAHATGSTTWASAPARASDAHSRSCHDSPTATRPCQRLDVTTETFLLCRTLRSWPRSAW